MALSTDPDVTNTCDYYFVCYFSVSGSANDVPSDWIFAFSDPAHHNEEGANILFVDGFVEFVREPKFTETIEAFGREYEAKFGEAPEILEPY